MTEIEIATRLAASGEAGPVPCGPNSYFVPMRVSGTGCAWRAAHNEFAVRPKGIWLSEEMQRRVVGLPVTLGHPPGGTLNATSFQRSIIGILVFGFVKGEELWGIARIFDLETALDLALKPDEYALDTSPSVVFSAEGMNTTKTASGDTLVFEGKPVLLDHLAVVVSSPGIPGGVWSKGSVKENENVG